PRRACAGRRADGVAAGRAPGPTPSTPARPAAGGVVRGGMVAPEKGTYQRQILRAHGARVSTGLQYALMPVISLIFTGAGFPHNFPCSDSAAFRISSVPLA